MAITEPVNTDVVRLRLGVAADGVTVTLGPGRTFLPNAHRLATDGTASVTAASPTASTWYHVYGYEGSNGALLLEVVTTAPSAPYPNANGTARTKSGDASRRYLGSVYCGSNGKFRPMKHTQCQSLGNLVTFSAASAAGSVPVNLISALAATTVQTISLASIVPLTATHVRIQVRNNSNFQVYIANPDNGAASPTNYIATSNPGASDSMDIELSATQTISVLLSATSLLGGILGALLTGSVSITVQGYLYDR